jgi:hypothetical protein
MGDGRRLHHMGPRVAGEEAVTRNDQRKACIEAVAGVLESVVEYCDEHDYWIGIATECLDSLHGIAIVEGILPSQINGAIRPSGSILTNPPEKKP